MPEEPTIPDPVRLHLEVWRADELVDAEGPYKQVMLRPVSGRPLKENFTMINLIVRGTSVFDHFEHRNRFFIDVTPDTIS